MKHSFLFLIAFAMLATSAVAEDLPSSVIEEIVTEPQCVRTDLTAPAFRDALSKAQKIIPQGPPEVEFVHSTEGRVKISRQTFTYIDESGQDQSGTTSCRSQCNTGSCQLTGCNAEGPNCTVCSCPGTGCHCKLCEKTSTGSNEDE